MTAISPLGSIHKKGIFGDHHKKNQNDLIQISDTESINKFIDDMCKVNTHSIEKYKSGENLCQYLTLFCGT